MNTTKTTNLIPAYQLWEQWTIDINDIYARGSLSIQWENSELTIPPLFEETSIKFISNWTTTFAWELYTVFEKTSTIKNPSSNNHEKRLQVYVKTSEISNVLKAISL